MGRFAYIPIDYDNLDIGLEREILIKRDTDDLYVLDDFKVPVTVTKKIRELTKDLPDNIDPWYNKLKELNSKFIDIKLECQGYEKDLLDYTDIVQNDFYKRIEALKDKLEYLKNLINEINKNQDSNNQQLSKIINEYTIDLDKILKMVQFRYNDNFNYFNKYKIWKINYENKLTELEEDIVSIKRELEKKMFMFGTLSIDAETENEALPTDVIINVWCNQTWLSNPEYADSKGSSFIYKYPGNNTLTGQKGVWSYDDMPIPMNDDFFEVYEGYPQYHSGNTAFDFYVTDENFGKLSDEVAQAFGMPNADTAFHINYFIDAYKAGKLKKIGKNNMVGWGRGNFYPAPDCPSQVLALFRYDPVFGGHGGHSVTGKHDYTSKFPASTKGLSSDYLYIEGDTVSFNGSGKHNSIMCPVTYYTTYVVSDVLITQPEGSTHL